MDVSSGVLFSLGFFSALLLFHGSTAVIRRDNPARVYLVLLGITLFLFTQHLAPLPVALRLPYVWQNTELINLLLLGMLGLSLVISTVCSLLSKVRHQRILYALATTLPMAFFMTSALVSLNLTLLISGLLTHSLMMTLISSLILFQREREREATLSRAKQTIKIAHTDTLTGCKNRYSFDQELANIGPFGRLAVIDLDGLKLHNDQLGHEAGDRLLRRFGVCVQEQLEGGSQLFRLGGDEFAILARYSQIDALKQQVERAVGTLKQEGYSRIGASVGIAERHETEDVDALFRLADQRMYQHKQQKPRHLRRDGAAAAPQQPKPGKSDKSDEIPLEPESKLRAGANIAIPGLSRVIP